MNQHLRVTVELPDGTMLARTAFSLPMAEGYFWWVQEAVASHFECNADDVDEIETDDGDMLTVKGEVVARCFIGNRGEKPARVAHLMAAE